MGGNLDNVEFDLTLNDLKWKHDNGLITLTGYAFETIQRLELEEIQLGWLACRMGVDREALRYAVRTLQKRELINIQLLKPSRIRMLDDE